MLRCCTCGMVKPAHCWSGQALLFGCVYARAQMPPKQCGCNDGSYIGIWTKATPVIDKCVFAACCLSPNGVAKPSPAKMNQGRDTKVVKPEEEMEMTR